MNTEEAKELLSFHSGRNEDIENLLWKNGFLPLIKFSKDEGSLEIAFHEVMVIIFTLSEYLEENQLEKNVIADLWCIVEFGKTWGYSNTGVFSDDEQKKIENYVDHISYTVACLLDGTGVEIAFEMYEHDYPNKI